MRIHKLLRATCTVLLAACTTPPVQHTEAGAKSTWIRYVCSDGQVVQASYPDTDTALVNIKGSTHTLHSAMSGSGARYIGDGWQWWTKGMHDGLLAPLAVGESFASATGVSCHAD